MQKVKCPLCMIPKKETLLYEDRSLYLVSTKNLKGHVVRVMVTLQRHSTTATFEEQVQALFLLHTYMQSKIKHWCMVADTYASVKDHWHIIACDLQSLDKKEVEQLAKTPKVLFPLKFTFEEAKE